MENFIQTFQVSPEVCDGLIEYHKNNTEYKVEALIGDRVRKYIKESIDVTVFNNSSDPAVTQYFSELQDGYLSYVEKYNIANLRLTAEIGHNIQYYPPGGGFKKWHHERIDIKSTERQLVYMTYLNDVDDGGTEWMYQELKLDARKGLSVIWPSDFTHTHRGVVSSTQEKWIATGWFKYD